MTQQPPPPGYTPGAYPNYQTPPPQGGAGIGLAVASLVLGILSIPCFCFTWFDLPLGIVAIILGFIALNKAKTGQAGGKGMATAGLILGCIGFILALVLIIVGFVAGPAIQQKLMHFSQQMQQQQQQMQQQKGASATAPSTER